MSEMEGSAEVGASLRELERRLALASVEGPLSLQDQLDWAEGLLGEGGLEEGRLLLQSAGIQRGVCSPGGGVPCGLDPAWGRSGGRPPPTGLSGNTVELAMSEVRALAQTVGPLIAGRVVRRVVRTTFSPGLHPVAVLSKAAPRPSGRALNALVQELFLWLQAPERGEDASAGALIDELRGAPCLSWRTARGFSGAPRSLLAEVVALTSLRRFLQASADLLHAPVGSISLFHATGRLDGVGLGPYFSNVGQIVRSSADMFELAGLAAETCSSGRNEGLEEAWVALMSRGLTDGLLDEVIDDLGDRNAAFALEIILDRLLQAPSDEQDTFRLTRIRDAALDNLDYALASRAQRAVVDLKPADHLERAILGAIDASGGRYKAAEDSFVACLAQTPEDEDLKAWLEAGRMRRFQPYAITQGFGSPRDRQLYRLRRRVERHPPLRA